MIDMSHMPLWLAPSSPVTPARSSTNVTPHWCSATSISTWSKARLRNVAYSATTGCIPAMASPAADVTACCSAMPTSKVRSGNIDWNLSSPTGCIIAAVIATTSGRRSPRWTISSANTSVQIRSLGFSTPLSTSNGPGLWNWSASCSSAASYPKPLRVIACTITGPLKRLACASTCSIAARS